jgi:transposase
MRRSFDGLALAVREQLHLDPQSGALFVFGCKRAMKLKVLWLDRNGYCILYKRLDRARFVWPERESEQLPLARIDARALARLLLGEEKDQRARKSLDERSRIDHHTPW